MIYFDPSHFVERDFVLIEDPRHAILSLAADAILQITLDKVIVDFAITSDVFSTK